MSSRAKAAVAGGALALGLAVALRSAGPSLPDEYLGRWYLQGTGGGIDGSVSEEATGASIVITTSHVIEHYDPDGALRAREAFSLSYGPAIFGPDSWILDEGSPVP